jgi:hypothetical protein
VEFPVERVAGWAREWRIVRSDAWVWALLVGGIAVAVCTPFVSAAAYGGEVTWPSMATSFSSTFLAFLVALAWDRRQRQIAVLREDAALAQRAAEERRAEIERRESEARRRFAALELELERVEASLRRTVEEAHRYRYFFPDLPTGSWRASNSQLAFIVGNYALMADLSTFYGQVEEMRWRLRFKASSGVDGDEVTPLVMALARELLGDVSHLRAAVAQQVRQPEVEPVLEPPSSALAGRRQLTETIRVVDLAAGVPTAGDPPA